jgi:hypothetical protein
MDFLDIYRQLCIPIVLSPPTRAEVIDLGLYGD